MNPASIRALRKLDPAMDRLIQKVGPIRHKADPGQTPYVALTRSIIFQQLHGKAAATIHARMLGLFPKKRHPSPEELLAIPETSLRGAGVSASKSLCEKDLALKTSQGIVPDSRKISRMSEEEIIERLTAIRGVGRWTVEMLLIFKLGRPDVLPASDYGVRNGFARLFKLKDLPTPKELGARGARWAPYRTTAALYLWAAVDLAKDEKAAKAVKTSRSPS